LKVDNLVASMDHHCHANAVAQFFFQRLNGSELRVSYTTRQGVRRDVIDYIETLCNPKRRLGFNNQLSPVFKKRYTASLDNI